MNRLSYDSPVGPLTLTESDGRIVALDWKKAAATETTPVLLRAADQLKAYFNGALTRFSLPLDPAGTPFQKSVWRALSDIPFGQTRTYGDVARALDTSPRPVGMACGRNPIPIIIPCHRVLGANRRLTGYSGGAGLDTKSFLLKLEKIDHLQPA